MVESPPVVTNNTPIYYITIFGTTVFGRCGEVEEKR
jgi:hypothetical protein